MKNKFCILLVAIIFTACNENEDVSGNQPFQLIGEWCSDNIEGREWDKMKFSESGEFYYANEETKVWNASAQECQGRYRIIGEDMIECSYYSDDVTFSRNMILLDVSESGFTADCYEGQSIGVRNYFKLLESYEMKWKESFTPNYAKLLTDDILQFKSHKPEIADVDPTTGELTARFPGRTLVDITTKDKTAVIEVIVADLWKDYTKFFGKTRNEVKEIMGTPLYEYDMIIKFKVNDDDLIESVGFMQSSLTNKVDRVILNLKEDCDKQLIVDFLKSKLYLEETFTDLENEYYSFYNKETYFKSSYSVSYDGISNSLVYLSINN